MKKVFSARANICNTGQFNAFQTHIPTLKRCGLNSIHCKANQLWNLLPENFKSPPSLTLFKNEMKLWEYFNCSSNLCSSDLRLLYFTQLAFLLHFRQFLILVWVLSRSYVRYWDNAHIRINIWRRYCTVLVELY